MKNRLKVAAFIFYFILIMIILVNAKNISVDKLLSYSPENIYLATFALLLVFTLKGITVFFPIVVLHIASGFLYPAPAAIIINCIGTALACTLPYIFGTHISQDKVEDLINRNKNVSRIINEQRSHIFFLPFFLRVISCLPCDIIGFYIGALRIPFVYYVAASVLGALPGIIGAVLIGENITHPLSPEFIFSVIITVSCSALSAFIFYIYNKMRSKKDV